MNLVLFVVLNQTIYFSNLSVTFTGTVSRHKGNVMDEEWCVQVFPKLLTLHSVFSVGILHLQLGYCCDLELNGGPHGMIWGGKRFKNPVTLSFFIEPKLTLMSFGLGFFDVQHCYNKEICLNMQVIDRDKCMFILMYRQEPYTKYASNVHSRQQVKTAAICILPTW
jgi:hypothetical protein